MNDTTRRFLTAIVERIPTDGRIVELRLFPAIRQGGMESAVAVVAVELAEPALPVASSDAADADASVIADVDATHTAGAPGDEGAVTPDYALAAHDLVDTDVIGEDEEGVSGVDVETTPSFVPHADAADDGAVGEALDEELQTIVVDVARDVVAAEARAFAAAAGTHPAVNIDEAPTDATHDSERQRPAEPRDDTAAALSTTDVDHPADSAYRQEQVEGSALIGVSLDDSLEDSPYADAPRPAESSQRHIPADVAAPESRGVDPEVMRLDDILALSAPERAADPDIEDSADDTAVASEAIRRYAILTASYRLTLKGPDRGKWDVELTHEADAPLATVARVARGVAKRAGEDSEPEHFSGESLQQALDAPAWVTTA